MRHIDPKTTVNQLLIDHPVVIKVLNDFGVDACCGGASTLEEAATNDNIDLDTLLAALERLIAGDETPTPIESAQ